MALEKQLHVVALNTPYPADYGGVIDIYHRLCALHDAGVGVVLHCFEYGRKPAAELEEICCEVHYYHRNRSPLSLLSAEPFIVSTRRNVQLRDRLMQDCLPILLEGVHCSSLLLCDDLRRTHPMWLRMHNIEADYYRMLSTSTPQAWQRLYLALEAHKLQRFEPRVLPLADRLFAISAADAAAARAMGLQHVEVMPPCLPATSAHPQTGIGNYALFHGNLQVAENHRVAAELLQCFAHLPYPLVVAGHKPPKYLLDLAGRADNLRVVASPSDAEMHQLITDAHICLMFTHQATGLKLKLLRSLAEGRHCVANPAMVEGTGLQELCHIVGHIHQLPGVLPTLMNTPFTGDMALHRSTLLEAYNAQQAIQPLLRALHDYTNKC